MLIACLIPGLLFGGVSSLQETVEIDLKRGLVKGYSEYVTFLTSPRLSSTDECDAQAVVRINFAGLYYMNLRSKLWNVKILVLNKHMVLVVV